MATQNTHPVEPNSEAQGQPSEGTDSLSKSAGRRKSPGIVRQRLLDGLSLAERLTSVAQQPSYAPKLANYGLDAAFLTSFIQNIAACRAGIAHLADNRGTKSTATQSENSARMTLLNGLQEAQTVAKLKLTLQPTETALKSRYFLGQIVRGLKRSDLESAADQIIAHLKTDHLTGFDAAKISALETALAAWRAEDQTQGSAQSAAITTRQELLTRYAEVERQRRAIQLAADALYPYTDKQNAGIRGEFAIPKTRPFKQTL